MTLGSIIFPLYIYYSALMLDHIFFTFYSLISRIIFFFTPYKSKALKEKRNNLVKDILELVDKYMETVDPKYKKERILYRQEAEENMSEERIFIRRNSMRKTSISQREKVIEAIEAIDESEKDIKY